MSVTLGFCVCDYCGGDSGEFDENGNHPLCKENAELLVKAKALDLLVEMARAGEVIEICADATAFTVLYHHWTKAKNMDDFHYSSSLTDALSAAYTAWKEGEA